MNNITVWFDGSCEPINPGGQMGFGTMIKEAGKVLHTIAGHSPAAPINTNNIAEYQALIQGLRWLSENGYNARNVLVQGDSKLVINQMAGEWRAKAGAYLPYYKQAKELSAQFPKIRFQWVPRAENSEADSLSRGEPISNQ